MAVEDKLVSSWVGEDQPLEPTSGAGARWGVDTPFEMEARKYDPSQPSALDFENVRAASEWTVPGAIASGAGKAMEGKWSEAGWLVGGSLIPINKVIKIFGPAVQAGKKMIGKIIDTQAGGTRYLTRETYQKWVNILDKAEENQKLARIEIDREKAVMNMPKILGKEAGEGYNVMKAGEALDFPDAAKGYSRLKPGEWVMGHESGGGYAKRIIADSAQEVRLGLASKAKLANVRDAVSDVEKIDLNNISKYAEDLIKESNPGWVRAEGNISNMHAVDNLVERFINKSLINKGHSEEIANVSARKWVEAIQQNRKINPDQLSFGGSDVKISGLSSKDVEDMRNIWWHEFGAGSRVKDVKKNVENISLKYWQDKANPTMATPTEEFRKVKELGWPTEKPTEEITDLLHRIDKPLF